MTDMTRRDFLGFAAAGAGAAMLPFPLSAMTGGAKPNIIFTLRDWMADLNAPVPTDLNPAFRA